MSKHCYCREESKGFMIQCDGCRLWFHGQCVKITRKSSKADQDWYCMWCNQCRNSAKNMIEEQEKMRGDIRKLEGELEDLKATVRINKGDLHSDPKDNEEELGMMKAGENTCDDGLAKLEALKRELTLKEKENVGLQKINDDILAKMDILKKEVALKEEENLSLTENYGREDALKEENLGLKKNYDFVLTKVDSLEKELAVKEEELNSAKMNFQEEKELLVKHHNTELDQAFREIGSLRQSNADLEQRLVTKRKCLSLSQRKYI